MPSPPIPSYHFTHAQIAARLLREAAAHFRATGDQDERAASRMAVQADIYEQVAAMIETDPTGACERLPQPSFRDGGPLFRRVR